MRPTFTRALKLKREILTTQRIDAAHDDGSDPFLHVNRVLYELCAACPHHAVESEIIGKILLIGRTYAAAVERRRDTSGMDNDRFYTEQVVPALRTSSLDADLLALGGEVAVTRENLPLVLGAHDRLVEVLDRLTKLKKRSLASKYLHFHQPALFFIMDSRAWQGVRRLTSHISPPQGCRGFEPLYTAFCLRALWLRDQIETHFDLTLTPRQLDRLLLGLASRAGRPHKR